MKDYDFSLIEKHLLKELETNRVAGSSLLVYKDGKILFDKNFGYANIERGYKITDDTRFRLASMTKPITAVATVIAQEMGLLNIDDYVYKYIPEVKDLPIKDLEDKVTLDLPFNFTIKQCLNHSAGFASSAMEATNHKYHVKDCNLHVLKDFIPCTKDFGLFFEPGTKFGYSGSFAYNLVARIIEITSGMTFIEFLDKYLFKPLGMNHTSYTYDKGEEQNKAISYRSVDGKLEYTDDEDRGFDLFYPGFNSGGAGLISTKGDYFKFAMMLYGRGIYNGVRILKEESFNQMLEYTPTPNCDTGGIETFGLSFYVRARKFSAWQKLPYNCFGWSGAYGTHFWVDPDNHMVVIYMHNSLTFGGAGAPQHLQLESDVVDTFKLTRHE